ncbi:tetratricopeptide repeat protein [Flavisericum labens]|uniref:tetratricopeptide repeat protein n=1 Tax=Flavisericum labens TaxID=3377112 RepID=UPI00387AFF1F
MEDQNYILFEAYLSKELTKGEVVDFESRLKTDADFNQAFNTYKELNSFLEHKYQNEEASLAFEDNLKKISTEYFNKEKTLGENKGKVRRFNFYKYAISACVVLLFGIFMFNQFSTPTYSDYNNYGAISLSVRGENDALLKTAETAFNNKDFAKADEAFKSLLESDSNNSELKLYRAVSNIELNKFEIAEGLLNQVRNGNSAFKNKATWYLALSKLKQEQNDACLEILKTIPEDTDDYKRAQKLIGKLD